MIDLQAQIDALKDQIMRNEQELAQMEMELTLFEQDAVKDKYGTIITYVNYHN